MRRSQRRCRDRAPAVPQPGHHTLRMHLSVSEGRGCKGARCPFLEDLLGPSLHILIRFLCIAALGEQRFLRWEPRGAIWVSSALPTLGRDRPRGHPSRGSEGSYRPDWLAGGV